MLPGHPFEARPAPAVAALRHGAARRPAPGFRAASPPLSRNPGCDCTLVQCTASAGLPGALAPLTLEQVDPLLHSAAQRRGGQLGQDGAQGADVGRDEGRQQRDGVCGAQQGGRQGEGGAVGGPAAAGSSTESEELVRVCGVEGSGLACAGLAEDQGACRLARRGPALQANLACWQARGQQASSNNAPLEAAAAAAPALPAVQEAAALQALPNEQAVAAQAAPVRRRGAGAARRTGCGSVVERHEHVAGADNRVPGADEGVQQRTQGMAHLQGGGRGQGGRGAPVASRPLVVRQQLEHCSPWAAPLRPHIQYAKRHASMRRRRPGPPCPAARRNPAAPHPPRSATAGWPAAPRPSGSARSGSAPHPPAAAGQSR